MAFWYSEFLWGGELGKGLIDGEESSLVDIFALYFLVISL